MKKLFIIANWKSNKTQKEAGDWLDVFLNYNTGLSEDKTIIICPSFQILPYISTRLTSHNTSLKIGSQNVSQFDAGSFTGEINAAQITEFADYVIIGHSERRKNFFETEDILNSKVKQALNHGLIPVYCVQDEHTPVPDRIKLVAYEPPGAIGTGRPDTPENADQIAGIIKNKYPAVESVLYGGSVIPENISGFTQKNHISGVLVGKASLDPVQFASLIKNA